MFCGTSHDFRSFFAALRFQIDEKWAADGTILRYENGTPKKIQRRRSGRFGAVFFVVTNLWAMASRSRNESALMRERRTRTAGCGT